MFKLGITGGLGSGKSLAASFFAENGAFVFDADHEAKRHLKTSKSTQRNIINSFGEGVINPAGDLDFKLLAKTAFKHTDRQQILNRILWPEVESLISEASVTAENNGYELFVVDAALLIEANFKDIFDALLVITASEEIRIERARMRGNLTVEQIRKRMQLQLPDAEKVKAADYIIENNGTVSQYRAGLAELFHNILHK